jgi:hypothetical protein
MSKSIKKLPTLKINLLRSTKRKPINLKWLIRKCLIFGMIKEVLTYS